jgi:DNA-binding response OmpR family regulator
MANDQCDFVGPNWPTLLTIDDDPQISEAIAARLSGFEIHVLRAFHGMHGFWLAMTSRPDLIVTDVRMPQGSGDYVVDCLRSNSDTHDIPIIVLSGQRDQQLESRMRRLGVSNVFTKPVPFNELAEAIGQHVRLRERAYEKTGPIVD